MAFLRDLALILFAFMAAMPVLALAVVIGALIYGLWWVNRPERLPGWLKLGRAYVDIGQAYVELAMAQVVKPILWLGDALAQVQRWLGIPAESGGSEQ